MRPSSQQDYLMLLTMNRLYRCAFFCASLLLSPFFSSAQVQVENTLTPAELVQQVLLGSGVTVTNVTFNGAPATTVSSQAGKYIGPSDFIAFDEGIVLSSGAVQEVTGGFGDIPISWSDPDLQQLSGQTINDAAVLEFDFIPNGDSLAFEYVFASTEYPGYTCSTFNDGFGFFMSGPGFNGPYSNNAVNIALIPNSNTPVAVNTINSGTASGAYDPMNCENANPNWQEDSQYFVDNSDYFDNPDDIQIPGMTQTLIAFANVTCGETYHIKLAIGDASDWGFSSMVFLKAGSFSSNSSVQVDFSVPVGLGDSVLYEGCSAAILEFIRPAGEVDETAYLEFSGTALNGIDFQPALPDSVFFPAGVDTVTFVLTAAADGVVEGLENFILEITNIASECSGAVITSTFEFMIGEAEPLSISGFDTSLIDCNDEAELFPEITGGYGEYNYSWSTGEHVDTLVVSPGFTTNYFLTVSDTCGAGSVQTSFNVEVPQYDPVVADAGDDIDVNSCNVTVNIPGSAVGGFGNYHYTWYNEQGVLISENATLTHLVEQTETIQLIVTDDCGATGEDFVQINAPEVEVTAFLPDIFTATSCMQELVMPVVSDGGIGNKLYRWYVDGTLQYEGDSPYFVYTPDMGTDVVIVASDECNNSSSDSITVALDYPPVTITPYSADTSICRGTEAVIGVTASDGLGNFSYSWTHTPQDVNVVTVKPDESQTYRVTVTDTCGTTASQTIQVNIREVVADFEAIPLDYNGYQFYNRSRPADADFLWTFGKDGTSTEMSPTHYFQDITKYWVSLLVTDEAGCTDYMGYEVVPPLEFFIPNSFTPNGDGINDLFFVKGSNIEWMELTIFDKFGKEVAFLGSVKDTWNGTTNKGEYLAQPGVYNYLLKIKGKSKDEVYEHTGSINLLR